jgi:hypothetical protein
MKTKLKWIWKWNSNEIENEIHQKNWKRNWKQASIDHTSLHDENKIQTTKLKIKFKWNSSYEIENKIQTK